MYKKTLAEKKGIAGLNVLLSIVSMLFMIGIIIMVYIVAGNKLSTTIGDPDASASINQTIQALDDVPGWFSTFIVLAALVVMVLMVVIIINSIKGSGLTGEGSA